MGYLLALLLMFLIMTLISWVSLLIVIPISQKLADFSMPPWPEALWKLAVVAASGNLLAIVLDPVNVVLSWIAGFVVLWILMVKWFHADFLGAVVVVLLSWIFRIVLILALGSLIAGLGG